MFCTRCGAQNPDVAAFCGNCGNRMAVAQAGPAAPVPPAASPPAPAPQPAYAAAPAQRAGQKSYVAALLLSFFVGGFGVDRFYLGYVGLGILKLVTLGGCGLWSIIDFVLIATGNLKDAKDQPLAR